MAITKEVVHNVTVLHSGHLEVQEVTILSEDGVEIAHKNHRWVIAPDEVLSKRPERERPGRVVSIAHAVASESDRVIATAAAIAERA